MLFAEPFSYLEVRNFFERIEPCSKCCLQMVLSAGEDEGLHSGLSPKGLV